MKSLEERRRSLAEAIDVAESVKALATHPETLRWFKLYEQEFVEQMIGANDEETRASAVAQVRAVRALQEHMTAIKTAAQTAERKLRDLKDVKHA